MAKRKKKYCALDGVPEEVSIPEKGYTRVARNLWVGKDGWIVRHYHEGEMHTEEYATKEALLESYMQFNKKPPPC